MRLMPPMSQNTNMASALSQNTKCCLYTEWCITDHPGREKED